MATIPQPADDCRWPKNSKAVVHLKVWSVPKYASHQDLPVFMGPICDPVHDDSLSEMMDPHQWNCITDTLNWEKKPLEIIIGKKFSVEFLESMVQTMGIGEVQRVHCHDQQQLAVRSTIY